MRIPLYLGAYTQSTNGRMKTPATCRNGLPMLLDLTHTDPHGRGDGAFHRCDKTLRAAATVVARANRVFQVCDVEHLGVGIVMRQTGHPNIEFFGLSNPLLLELNLPQQIVASL